MTDKSSVASRNIGAVATLLGLGDSLENVGTSVLDDGCFCYVESELKHYELHKSDTSPPSPPNIIKPISGPGRWVPLPSSGSQGPQGAQGRQGAQGTQGAGFQGAQGATGTQGFQGAQGTQGAGFQGAQGATGSQGATGAQGAQGNAGAQGSQGSAGAQGNAGSQGAQGAQGAAGAQGNQGAQGAAGAQGNQGAQGFQGNQGFQGGGAQGAQGSTGAQGSGGGAQGAQGATGVQGFQGAQGFQGGGFQGAQGTTGPQGPGGGAQGAQGAQGFQGAQAGAFQINPTSIAGLQAVNTTALATGTIADVGTVRDAYRLNKTPTAAETAGVDATNIVPATTVSGELWERLGLVSRAYGFVADLYVDSVNGLDTNDGLTALTALKTVEELSQRLCPGGQVIILHQSTTIHLLGAGPYGELDLNIDWVAGTSGSTFLNVVGAVSSSAPITLSAVGNTAVPTTRGQVTTLSGTFTAGKRIRSTSGAASGAICFSTGQNTSPSNHFVSEWFDYNSGTLKTVASGTTCVVDTLQTTLRVCRITAAGTGYVQVQDLIIVDVRSVVDVPFPLGIFFFGCDLVGAGNGEWSTVGTTVCVSCRVVSKTFVEATNSSMYMEACAIQAELAPYAPSTSLLLFQGSVLDGSTGGAIVVRTRSSVVVRANVEFVNGGSGTAITVNSGGQVIDTVGGQLWGVSTPFAIGVQVESGAGVVLAAAANVSFPSTINYSITGHNVAYASIPVGYERTGAYVAINPDPGATSGGSQGAQGAQGVAGSQGAQGFQGATGQTGAGSQGAQGASGAQGFQGGSGAGGAQGSQGRQGAQGATGTAGSTGAQGAQGGGFQGAQGFQGAAGSGSQGAQGATGTQGFQGATGAQGSQGAQGATGATGNQGAQGATGTQGFQGAQGTQGAGSQGAQGSTGAQGAGGGAQGAQGATGTQGFQGAQGFQGGGFQGAQGAQAGAGAQGSQGAQGAQGQSVTGAQGAQGSTGTQGFQGATGSGSQGAQGATGTTGAQGFQGATGAGTQGAQGATGTQGLQGAQGRQGATGSTGTTGSQGAQGATGNTGATGAQGATGAGGAQGFQGGNGAGGAQGSQGRQGAQGSQGATGVQGFQGSGFQGAQGAQGRQGFQGAQGTQGFQGSTTVGPLTQVFYVDAANVGTATGSIQQPYASPTAALAAHTTGSITLLVAPGNYGGWTINTARDVTLIGLCGPTDQSVAFSFVNLTFTTTAGFNLTLQNCTTNSITDASSVQSNIQLIDVQAGIIQGSGSGASNTVLRMSSVLPSVRIDGMSTAEISLVSQAFGEYVYVGGTFSNSQASAGEATPHTFNYCKFTDTVTAGPLLCDGCTFQQGIIAPAGVAAINRLTNCTIDVDITSSTGSPQLFLTNCKIGTVATTSHAISANWAVFNCRNTIFGPKSSGRVNVSGSTMGLQLDAMSERSLFSSGNGQASVTSTLPGIVSLDQVEPNASQILDSATTYTFNTADRLYLPIPTLTADRVIQLSLTGAASLDLLPIDVYGTNGHTLTVQFASVTLRAILSTDVPARYFFQASEDLLSIVYVGAQNLS